MRSRAAGRTVVPLALATVLEDEAHVHDFQVVQTGTGALKVRLAGEDGASAAAVRRALRAYFQAMGLPTSRLSRRPAAATRPVSASCAGSCGKIGRPCTDAAAPARTLLRHNGAMPSARAPSPHFFDRACSSPPRRCSLPRPSRLLDARHYRSRSADTWHDAVRAADPEWWPTRDSRGAPQAAAARAGDQAFASSELGLPDNSSYRQYADLGRPYVVWNVFATRELSLDLKHGATRSSAAPVPRLLRPRCGRARAQRCAPTATRSTWPASPLLDARLAARPLLNTFIGGSEGQVASRCSTNWRTRSCSSAATHVQRVLAPRSSARRAALAPSAPTRAAASYAEFAGRRQDFVDMLLRYRDRLERCTRAPSGRREARRQAAPVRGTEVRLRGVEASWAASPATTLLRAGTDQRAPASVVLQHPGPPRRAAGARGRRLPRFYARCGDWPGCCRRGEAELRASWLPGDSLERAAGYHRALRSGASLHAIPHDKTVKEIQDDRFWLKNYPKACRRRRLQPVQVAGRSDRGSLRKHGSLPAYTSWQGDDVQPARPVLGRLAAGASRGFGKGKRSRS